jgi:ribosome-binding factor A
VRRNRERRPVGSYPRTARINELLREVLAEELERFADVDGTLRLLTVTGVEITADLATAKVYLSSMDQPIADALGERRAYLQRAIGRQVRMKRTPKLQFVADPAVAEGAKVEEILQRLKKGSGGAQKTRQRGAEEAAAQRGAEEAAAQRGAEEAAAQDTVEGPDAGG